MSYTLDYSLDFGPAHAGLADLRAQLVNTDGANSGSAISTGFAEIGTGLGYYLWHYVSFADGFRGGVYFYSNAAPTALLGFVAINPEEAEDALRIKAQTDQLAFHGAYLEADLKEWLDSAPNSLIAGRLDANAQVINDKSGYTLTAGEHTQVGADVLDVLASAHNTASTIGAKINSSGSLADPWDTLLPGAYSAGKAGYLVGHNLDGQISLVKAQTDQLVFDGSGYVKSAPQTDEAGVTTLLGRLSNTRAGYLDLLSSYLNASVSSVYSLVSSVKTQTDLLPSDPASETSVEAAISAAEAAIAGDIATIMAKTNNLPGAPAAVGSQMDLVDAPNVTAVAALQAGLATAASLTTALNRLGAWTGTGRNTVLGALQAIFRKDVDATVPTDINTDLGSGAGTADNTTDSVEAIRDQGDAAWGAGGAPTAIGIAEAVWDELRSAHTDPGSFGQGAASVQGSVTGSVASVTGNVGGNVNGNLQGSVVGSVASVTGNVGGTVPDSSGTTTLLARLTSARAGYLDALAGFAGTLLAALRALARKDVSPNTDLGGTHDPATDSEEALSAGVAAVAPGTSTTENVTVNELGT